MAELHVALRHRFDQRFALEVAFEVPSGITVLQGPSGAGKTSVLQMIAGVQPADFADIRLGARSLTALKPEQRNVSLVFQSLALFPHLTVSENVGFGANATPALAAQWLEALKISHLANRKPKALSGGEAQRVALARALARRPQILLLDEPFSALDDPLRVELTRELSEQIARLSLPTLWVTHDRRDVASLGARTITLIDGRIQGSVNQQ